MTREIKQCSQEKIVLGCRDVFTTQVHIDFVPKNAGTICLVPLRIIGMNFLVERFFATWPVIIIRSYPTPPFNELALWM